MPTYEALAAFQRQWGKLDAQQREAFKKALAVFIASLKAGGAFSPELRVHKLVNTEIWSLTWAYALASEPTRGLEPLTTCLQEFA